MVTQFQVRLAEAVRKGRERELAGEFEVAVSTIWRWSEGKTRPHPKLQALVLKHLDEDRDSV